MMRIDRVACSWADKSNGKLLNGLPAFEGADAEAAADDFLRDLVARAPETRLSPWMDFRVTLENWASWDFRQNLDYTYPADTIRRLVAAAAQLETFYGDAPGRANAFRRALLSDD